jgi:adhesin/invasin
VEDKNHNLLPDVPVNWKADRSDVTLTPENATTNSNGEVTTSGTSFKAGKVVVTAVLTSPAKERSANAVAFIGDAKTAKVGSLNAAKTIAVINTDRVELNATITDAHDNPVPHAEVNWQTTLNELSATTSNTDATGVAKVTLSGTQTGQAKVTASINGSSKSSENIVFIAHYEADWNITGGSGWFKTQGLFGFESLGFIAIGETDGPKELVWEDDPYSTLTVPMTDEQGSVHKIKFRGQRHSNCSAHTFNTAATCRGWQETGYAASLTYSESDNPNLPAGVYRGVITFAGKDWHTTWSLSYSVTTILTVE